MTFYHKMIYLVNKNPLHVYNIWHIHQQQTTDQNNVLKNTGHQPHFHVITLQTWTCSPIIMFFFILKFNGNIYIIY